jgi:conjugal transfer/type IV secretion protein DotA/TraY
MEFDELFVPTGINEDYATGVLTRLFGSIVPQLHAGFDEGTVSIVGGNWLETIFVVFNTFLLLGMLVVLSYTIYAMIFDTAADGKTFGQNADTKYTILRLVLGVIGFVPVVGGYSLAQVALLWLVVQGSALADTTWRRIADEMLAGTPLVSGTISTVPPNQAARIRQFGEVFDTLVTGHLCGINANDISLMLSGAAPSSAAERSAMVSTQGVSGGPIREVRGGVSIETSEEWSVFSGDIATGMMRTSISFGEAAGGASYGGRDVYCGSVLVTDSYSGVVNGSGDIETGLMQARAQAQFEHFATTVLPRLSDRAHTVAMMIYNGERDQTNLLTPARAAVYEAVASYASVSGAGVDGLDDAATIATVHEELSDQVTLQGWMLAPVWQRGVAQTVGNLEMPGDTMQLAAVRENRITDFLSGRGYATDRGTTFDLLTSANIRQDTWDEISGAVRALPPPDAAIPQTLALGATPDVSDSVAQGLYTTILDFFSPVATATAEGDAFVDPMLQIQRQGQVLTVGGGTALAVGTTISVGNNSLIGRASDLLFGTGDVLDGVASGLVSVGTTVILAGMVMMIVLPLIPMIYYFSAVLSWVIQVIELMFAIPIAILRMFLPSRDASLVGDLQPMLLSVFSVFMRPFFMVVGLILTMMLLSVALTYLHELFTSLVFFIFPGGVGSPDLADATAVGAAANAAYGVFGLIKMLFFLALYLLMAFLTVLYGSQLISEFGDYAMQLIGAGVNRYTQTSNIADRTALAGGLSYAGMRNFGAQAGSLTRDRLKAGHRSADGRALPPASTGARLPPPKN